MGVRVAASFVGRASELERLDAALQETAAGRGSTALVSGDAGIGKTRLASELARRAADAGCEVLVGRCIDLVGTELPYQPFVEALRPLGGIRSAGSKQRLFEEVLELLSDRAAAAPVLLVLEDLHWADASTLDLIVFLAHNVDERPVLQLGTYRPDEPKSAGRMERLVDGVRRSGRGLVVDLGPLEPDELTDLLAARAGTAPPHELTDAIVRRSEGNPFFAEELLDAAGDHGAELPRRLRDLLLQRVARLDRRTQSLLRLAAAAGRDVGYALLREAAELPEQDVRDSLRRAVDEGVLVADQASSSLRFRHALLAEAIYATLLPGEREHVHDRLANVLARAEEAQHVPAELARHWEAAGRPAEALAASVDAARRAEAAYGLAEALVHVERALALWPAVPDPAALAGVDLIGITTWAAGLASQTGMTPRAAELARQAIELVGDTDPLRSALLHERLGAYLYNSGRAEAALAARRRAVELVPAEPPSPERAEVLAALGNTLMTAWRHDESLAVCEEALALARAVGARRAEFRALAVLGVDLAYLGRGDEGLATIESALRLAEEAGAPQQLLLAYVYLADVLTMLGRPLEAAAVAEQGIEILRPFGIDNAILVANGIEALVAAGAWDRADSASVAALRDTTACMPHMRLVVRAELDLGRGDFEAARMRLEAAGATVHEDRRSLQTYDPVVVELALSERRWEDALAAVREGMTRVRARDAAQIRVRLAAQGLRAQAELAALARARRDSEEVDRRLRAAAGLLDVARRAAEEAADVTPNAGGWLALAEAEHDRARVESRPRAWAEAASVWERLERPPVVAYCRWRQAEAAVATGASRAEAEAPLWAAHAVASRLGARPLLRELELLAERARLEPAEPEDLPEARQELEVVLGLTPREAEVLTLVARGRTNREIAAELVISVKTASVHVSHILRKLGAPNRLEAAAIAHRLAPPD
jgi:DNA-binding CsgD family transcriptional regulator